MYFAFSAAIVEIASLIAIIPTATPRNSTASENTVEYTCFTTVPKIVGSELFPNKELVSGFKKFISRKAIPLNMILSAQGKMFSLVKVLNTPPKSVSARDATAFIIFARVSKSTELFIFESNAFSETFTVGLYSGFVAQKTFPILTKSIKNILIHIMILYVFFFI